jgi:hypothetical protein
MVNFSKISPVFLTQLHMGYLEYPIGLVRLGIPLFISLKAFNELLTNPIFISMIVQRDYK